MLSNIRSMKAHYLITILSISSLLVSCEKEDVSAPNEIDLIFTTDTHGEFLTDDFMRNRVDSACMANIYSFVEQARDYNPRGTILLDGGDLTEGTPAMYYYNFEANDEPHLASQMVNFMQYDALCVGNHDLETGKGIYQEHLMKEFQMPWMAANVVDRQTDEPFFKPYCTLERKGYRIAVLGLLSTENNKWLPRATSSNLRFDSMIETAKKWVPIIEEREKPDLLVGLFHAGHEESFYEDEQGNRCPDGAFLVANEVRGFDVVLLAHDHQQENQVMVNNYGDSIYVLQPLPHADEVASLKVMMGEGRKANNHRQANCYATLHQTKSLPFSPTYLKRIEGIKERVDNFLDRPVGNVHEKLDAAAGLVGPSNLINLIHEVQFFITDADVSFVSCLSNFSDIQPGALSMRQLFSMYKYENQVFKMWMYGHEIDQFLEYGVGRQFNQMTSDKDHLLAFKYDENGEIIMGRFGPELVTPQYNYTQAAGIYYIVDVTQPIGERVTISTMANGQPFDPEKKYYVALSSHQASGGGGFLPYGLGWSNEECTDRTVTQSVKDMRSYISEFVYRTDFDKKRSSIGTWRVMPNDWWQKASRRDVDLLMPYLVR